MKKIFPLALLSILFATGCQGAVLGQPEIRCDKMINKGVVDICYNYQAKGPQYVSYYVEKDKVDSGNIEKRPSFYTEKNVPSKYRSKPADYTYATDSKTKKIYFNRGHLAPDADFDYDQKVLRKVYTMANIVPQEETNNQKNWIKAERYERYVAGKLGRVHVISGVYYNDPDLYLVKRPIEDIKAAKKWKKNKIISYAKKAKSLEKKHILIPTHLFKIVEDGNGFRKCFLYENRAYDKNYKLKDWQVECSQLPLDKLPVLRAE